MCSGVHSRLARLAYRRGCWLLHTCHRRMDRVGCSQNQRLGYTRRKTEACCQVVARHRSRRIGRQQSRSKKRWKALASFRTGSYPQWVLARGHRPGRRPWCPAVGAAWHRRCDRRCLLQILHLGMGCFRRPRAGLACGHSSTL